MAAYLAAACTRPRPCARAAEWLGAILGRRGAWAQAAAKYERAAREDPTPSRWLRLAEAAAHAGQPLRAQQALRRARRSGTTLDPAAVERVENALRRSVLSADPTTR